MKFRGLASFVDFLENKNELKRIKLYVNPDLEITEIYERIIKNEGPALLFDNNGTKFPLLINMFGSNKRICYALNVSDLDDIGNKIENIFKEFVSPKETLFDKLKMLPKLAQVSSFMPSKIKGKGECHDNIIMNPSLDILPVLKCWPFDGGKFITLPLVHTIDPETNNQNVGMYRMQIIDDKTTGMHWHIHKTGAKHFDIYKKLGIKMPVSVVLGGDPVYTYSATAPLPDNVDEYILAGFLREKSVELVKCITNDLMVPADSDFVIEGYVDPSEELFFEGPFGDHTGYYSLPDFYPKFHVTCITHKNNAVFPATIVGVPPQEDAYLGLATERLFIKPIQLSMLPELLDMYLPNEGGFHNIAVVKINKMYPGHAQKIMNSLWGAGQMMFNKIMIIVDEDFDIKNPELLMKVIVNNVNIESDILINKGPSDVLDHASYQFAYGGKIGIDATKKFSTRLVDDNEISISNITYGLIIDERYLKYGVLIVISESNSSIEIKDLKKRLENSDLSNINSVLLVNSDMLLGNDNLFIWRLSNNFDPAIDVQIVVSTNNEKILLINACAKNIDNNFRRDWPNIVVSNAETINRIDKIWSDLKIGDFIESPSLQFVEKSNIDSAFQNIFNHE
ncbi:MAG: menaquinone biosynthesis decarboxylase [Bacteroidota bacterium]